MVIQPLVGYYSDWQSFSRQRPFIFFGVIAVAIAALLIDSAADLGHALGDGMKQKTKPQAGPCRAFIGDLAVGDHRRMRTGNSLFSFYMAVGNVLSYTSLSPKLKPAIPSALI
ncbi:sucrose transport protein SUC5-like [Trifolium medium]|uniref:Sucrose transport protein SUC5-like n=1 Tax=Trifolium medium TaxID=97028 RepID=A0A392NTY1_9FABA|nr:sucrose transport protein SUC5-like [Trifolium medium]